MKDVALSVGASSVTEPSVAVRYFVLHLTMHDPERRRGFVFEIQVVDEVGQATSWILLSEKDRAAQIDGRPVPTPVSDAARRMPLGVGDFVDGTGQQVLPRDL